MRLKGIKIGDLELKNNVFLAPIAGFTDYSFRAIAYGLGAGLCFTELVSCKGLLYDNKKTAQLLYTDSGESVLAAQIFGNDPEIMQRACEGKELEKFKIIDINMGCPVPKLYNNGEGSALLKEPKLVYEIIKACAKSGKIITAKIRTGVKRGQEVTADFAKVCEQAGAAMVTVHGRVRESYYTGGVNYGEIERAKAAVKIPIIANGGIMTANDAAELLDKTGADGVMLARGALQDPFLISKLTGTKTDLTLKDLIILQIDKLLERFDSRHAAVIMRKRIAIYIKGIVNSKKYKTEIFDCEDAFELKKLISCFLD